MSATNHFGEAERLRERATEAQNHAYDNDLPKSWLNATYFNQAAQVHATLALAQALTDARSATAKAVQKVIGKNMPNSRSL